MGRRTSPMDFFNKLQKSRSPLFADVAGGGHDMDQGYHLRLGIFLQSQNIPLLIQGKHKQIPCN